MGFRAEDVESVIKDANRRLKEVNDNLYYCVYQYYQKDEKHRGHMSDRDQQDTNQVKELLSDKVEAALDRLARRELWLKEYGGVVFNYVEEKSTGNIPPPPEDPPG